MDWARAIDKNRDDLIEIVTRLFVLAGIRTGRSVILLPRHLRLRILSLLRPAEFAARRLILMAACRLVVAVRPVVEREARPSNSVILGFSPRTHSVKPETAADDQKGGSVLRLRERSGMGLRLKAEDDGAGAASRPAAAAVSVDTLPAFPLFDPFKPYGHPWLKDGDDDQAGAWRHPKTPLPPDELIDARTLCRRIKSLERGLQDVEGQAARLARWRARRHHASCKPKRWSPLRPGRPPGWRKRPKTAIEELVKECHGLALHAWDTS